MRTLVLYCRAIKRSTEYINQVRITTLPGNAEILNNQVRLTILFILSINSLYYSRTSPECFVTFESGLVELPYRGLKSAGRCSRDAPPAACLATRPQWCRAGAATWSEP